MDKEMLRGNFSIFFGLYPDYRQPELFKHSVVFNSVIKQ